MAIWDNALSENDRNVREARPSRSSKGLGERPAVRLHHGVGLPLAGTK